MKKKELIACVAANLGSDENAGARALDAVLSAIALGVGLDGEVSIQGFGGFTAKERAARKGRNPSTGETIDIAAKKYTAFKASPKLQDFIDNKLNEFANK